MRAKMIIGLAVVSFALASALPVATASASGKTLTLEEGTAMRVLEPGDGFSLYSFAPITLQTSEGMIECPYNADTTSGILRATDVSDGASTDEATVYAALGRLATKVNCTSSIASFPGPVNLDSEALPWALELKANGKAALQGDPEVVFEIYNAEAMHCDYERKKLDGVFARSLEIQFAGKLKLEKSASSATGCPTSGELTLPFQEANTEEGREAAHRVYAIVG